MMDEIRNVHFFNVLKRTFSGHAISHGIAGKKPECIKPIKSLHASRFRTATPTIKFP